MTKVSVIVSVYNTEEYLGDCLDSLFAQTLSDIEVIAVNDGSTDNCSLILRNYQKYHANLLVISQNNKGLSAARNAGINAANGRYLYFCDSDDFVEKDMLERCYSVADQNDADLVMFDAIPFGNDTVGNPYDRSDILSENRIYDGIEYLKDFYAIKRVPSACLYLASTDIIKLNGFLFIEGCSFEDNAFFCQLMSAARRICYINEKFYHRRYRNGSIMLSSFGEKKARDYLSVAKYISNIKNEDRFVNELMCINAADVACTGLSRLEELNTDKTFGSILDSYLHFLLDLGSKNEGKCREISYYFAISAMIDNDIPPSCFDDQIFAEYINGISRKLEDISINVTETILGVFGRGKITERFMKLCSMLFGKIEARIIFIDTFHSTGLDENGVFVCNVNDIHNYDISKILISSSRYESEMEIKIKELYDNRYPIIRIKSDVFCAM